MNVNIIKKNYALIIRYRRVYTLNNTRKKKHPHRFLVKVFFLLKMTRFNIYGAMGPQGG